jgi:6-phosphogluconolactonase (cycloisomerase 2 family)
VRAVAPDLSRFIWVTNLRGDSITAYKTVDTGDVYPSRRIVGSLTRLNGPYGIAKAFGSIYVANSGLHNNKPYSVTVYPKSSNGNVAPTRFICCNGLFYPMGIAVGPSGIIYVVKSDSSIVSYAADANGNAPVLTYRHGKKTQLHAPCGLAVHGGLLYVTNVGGSSITIYNANTGGDNPPLSIIEGPDTGLSAPCGIGFDDSGKMYVANHGSSSVTIYAPGATGDAVPLATIQGPNTLLNENFGVSVDGAGAQLFAISYLTNELTGYNLPADGDVAPFMAVSGSKTRLNAPLGIAF